MLKMLTKIPYKYPCHIQTLFIINLQHFIFSLLRKLVFSFIFEVFFEENLSYSIQILFDHFIFKFLHYSMPHLHNSTIQPTSITLPPLNQCLTSNSFVFRFSSITHDHNIFLFFVKKLNV